MRWIACGFVVFLCGCAKGNVKSSIVMESFQRLPREYWTFQLELCMLLGVMCMSLAHLAGVLVFQFGHAQMQRLGECGYCPYCGYDLRGAASRVCSECGAAIDRA